MLFSFSLGIGVAISLTATNLIVERASGLFDRSYVGRYNMSGRIIYIILSGYAIQVLMLLK